MVLKDILSGQHSDTAFPLLGTQQEWNSMSSQRLIQGYSELPYL